MQCPRCNSELRPIAGYQCLYQHTFTAPPPAPENYPFPLAAPGAQSTYTVEPVPHITALHYHCGYCGLIPIKYHLDLETAANLGLTADR
jgi:hypothetical protein